MHPHVFKLQYTRVHIFFFIVCLIAYIVTVMANSTCYIKISIELEMPFQIDSHFKWLFFNYHTLSFIVKVTLATDVCCSPEYALSDSYLPLWTLLINVYSCPKEMSTVFLLSASYRMLPTTVLVIMGSQLRRVLVTGSLPIHLSILAIYRLVK